MSHSNLLAAAPRPTVLQAAAAGCCKKLLARVGPVCKPQPQPQPPPFCAPCKQWSLCSGSCKRRGTETQTHGHTERSQIQWFTDVQRVSHTDPDGRRGTETKIRGHTETQRHTVTDTRTYGTVKTGTLSTAVGPQPPSPPTAGRERVLK